MADLEYRTRGNTRPQGKERIYFSCHPLDHGRCFDTVCEDVFKTQNCAIWYRPQSQSPWDPETMETELGHMQLFVIPVTSRFLYQPNPAREIELPFALQHHIPVLPLMQERGLEQEFNRLCGDLQFLDKDTSARDLTALPYAQRLERFLNAVLLGDELAAQVRSAFDAYIFLSYRKKDRKYAQALMRLIHQNDFCRDIAIWYDEFLVPGENFTQAIQEAMEKSSIFAFVVTPNLLEPGNYVMSIEYPAAMEANKPLLPVEMLPTDSTLLEAKFPKIPVPVQDHSLGSALADKLRHLALSETHSDPIHLFFIGLAYLSGIDVEEDRPRGVSLIRQAAENGVPEAMEKMSQIYKTGEGVDRDNILSAHWLQRLAEFWEDQFDWSHDEWDCNQCFITYSALGDAWRDLAQQSKAEEAYGRAWGYADTRLDLLPTDFPSLLTARTNAASSCLDLGDVYQRKGDFQTARNWYSEALTLIPETAQEDPYALNILIAAYQRMGYIHMQEGSLEEASNWYMQAIRKVYDLATKTRDIEDRRLLVDTVYQFGNLMLAQGDPWEAEECYRDALEEAIPLAEESKDPEDMQNLACIYHYFGEAYRVQGKLEDAEAQLLKANKIFRELATKLDTAVARRNLSSTAIQLGSLFLSQGALAKAELWLMQALEDAQALEQKTDDIEDTRQISLCFSHLGDVSKALDNYADSEQWLQRALAAAKTLVTRTNTPESRKNMLDILYELGNVCRRQGKIAESREHLTAALRLAQELVKNTETVSARRGLAGIYYGLGEIALAEKSLADAYDWYDKFLSVSMDLDEEMGTPEIHRGVFLGFMKLGDIHLLSGQKNVARQSYLEALTIARELVEDTEEPNAYDDLANIYLKVAGTRRFGTDRAMVKEAIRIWEDLITRCPGVSRYVRNLNHARSLLQKRF